MANEFTNNENRARLRDSLNRPTHRSAYGPPIGATSPNDLPAATRGDAPLTLSPHGTRHAAPNASAPRRDAYHIQNATPGYTGISPAVLRELPNKAPPYAARTIRDQLRKK
jgi:hypothetical protein